MVTSANWTSSTCHVHPVLMPVPITIRPFGIRGPAPALAASAAAINSGVVSAIRYVSPDTWMVAVRAGLGALELPPHADGGHKDSQQ